MKTKLSTKAWMRLVPLLALLLAIWGGVAGLAQQAPLPLLSKGHPVDWWFVFKFNAQSFPACGGGDTRSCPFGGAVAPYKSFGQQYVYASSESPSLQQGKKDCLGDGTNDPVGASFDEVYNGHFYYVVWNDQPYGDPKIAACTGSLSCSAPWGSSKGMVAWNDAGEGFVMQVSTPSWPASGSATFPRKTDGNTLGCVKDDNVMVSQHFFALRLTKVDLLAVLAGMGTASVVTDPSNRQLVNNGGPPDIQALVKGLGKISTSGSVTATKLSTGVGLISKPSGMHAPPWQVASAVLGGPSLRVGSWWAAPEIQSTSASGAPECWDSSLPPPGAVVIATSGQWRGVNFSMQGGASANANHAKIGVSTSGSEHYSIFGDLNQQGALSGNCAASQNGRGGLFFAVDNTSLWSSLTQLLAGVSASNNAGTPPPSPNPQSITPTAPPYSNQTQQSPSPLWAWLVNHRAPLLSALVSLLLIAVPLGLELRRIVRSKTVDHLSTIEEIVSSDSPVTSLKNDRLGQSDLVTRLSKFLRNPNTSPPMVISLQARWGMGKSSVMRMLESDLKANRAAVTVWFNAWHHQREDQLLAYLLETIQKNAVPPWFSWMGLSFRFDLLRVRLFSGIDKLMLTTASIAFFTFWTLRHEFFHQGIEKWALNSVLVVAILPLIHLMTAFKSNPEKLADKSGGVLVDTLKELVRMPSLIGKSDVRQEFANNLNDVVEALSPQRLVIFLDDLDRCKEDQVVQILEAINFLSSVAKCVIIVGADYEHVETLVAMQFQDIALREAENMGIATDTPIKLRVAYARNYLKKIVNLRLNLRPPTADNFAEMLTDKPEASAPPRRFLKRLATLVLLVAPIGLATGVAHWMFPVVTVTTTQTPTSSDTTQESTGSQLLTQKSQGPVKALQLTEMAVPNKPPERSTVFIYGVPGVIAFVSLVYWFSRPKRVEETKDTEAFAVALKNRSKEIFNRCGTPREVRRFLNYLRLIATEPNTSKSGKPSLRDKYASAFDTDLVDLASMGKMPNAGPEGADVKDYFEKQCERFGLDPITFLPVEIDLDQMREVLADDSGTQPSIG